MISSSQINIYKFDTNNGLTEYTVVTKDTFQGYINNIIYANDLQITDI